MDEPDQRRPPHWDQPDPDQDLRKEALRKVGRRAAIWTIPLAIVGLLLIGLGIPWWISVGAMVLMLIVLVFEIDL